MKTYTSPLLLLVMTLSLQGMSSPFIHHIAHGIYTMPKFSGQEDYSLHKIINDSSYFGVFDGHGGRDVAEYVRDSILTYIQNSKKPTKEEQFKDAFQTIDNDILNKHDNKNQPYCMDEGKKLLNTHANTFNRQGTTACMICIENGIIYFINTGDSRAILGSDKGKLLLETQDYTVLYESEKGRIQQNGGAIFENKIFVTHLGGRIDPSRTIGDADLKVFKRDANNNPIFCNRNNIIIPDPDVQNVALPTDSIGYVVLASDGFWNWVRYDKTMNKKSEKEKVTYANQETIKWVLQYIKMDNKELQNIIDDLNKQIKNAKEENNASLQQNQDKLTMIARILALQAASRGSTDDITVIVIQTRPEKCTDDSMPNTATNNDSKTVINNNTDNHNNSSEYTVSNTENKNSVQVTNSGTGNHNNDTGYISDNKKLEISNNTTTKIWSFLFSPSVIGSSALIAIVGLTYYFLSLKK